jgi:hypothetical protein
MIIVYNENTVLFDFQSLENSAEGEIFDDRN